MTREIAGRTLSTLRVVAGILLAAGILFAAGIPFAGCSLDIHDLLNAPQEEPQIIIGDLSLQRSARDSQRYLFTMQVMNRHQETLRGITVRAQFTIPPGDARELADTMMESEVSLFLPVEIPGGSRRVVEAGLESPFPVVPPEGMVMDRIFVGRAIYSEPATWWVQWPWPVHEELP